MDQSPRVSTVPSIVELAPFYADPPDGLRANMIFSADGAAAFGGEPVPCRVPPISGCCGSCAGWPTSSWSGRAPREPKTMAR
ncbi:hypothetical protein MINTMi198_29810 [Mycobacterium intracellulare M.i.198]|nr:hypothetical protein MINTMi198_29810 [Mycobacterium intracellulare M.i.198]